MSALPRRRLAPLATLWPCLRRYRGRLALALLVLLVAAGAMLAMPVAVRHLVDTGFVEGAIATAWFLVLLGLALLAAAAAALRFYLVSWLGERVVADLRSTLFRHLLGLGPTFYETHRAGELLSRLGTDTTLIQNVVGSSLSIALRSALTLLGALLMLTITSPRLTAVILVLVPLVVAPIVLLGRRVRRLSRDSQDRLADASAVAGEVLGAIGLVQALNLEPREAGRYDGAVETAFGSARRRIAQRAWLAAFAVAGVFAALVAVLWLGAHDVAAGRLSGGQLGQFVLYALFVGGSTAGLSEIWGALQQAAGAAERIAELLATRPELPAPAAPRPLPLPARGELVFERVGFTYPSRPGSPALVDFDLSLAAGETVALVGPSGAGKSTVLALALAFYRPQAGRVLLDGVDIATAAPAAVRERIAAVPQQSVLFATSIAENIRVGRAGASDAEVREAAAAAAAADFIEGLPDGYETLLGERGLRLSGGQQQRIALARALLRRPSVLLLDEATSALDAESEALVQAALARLAGTCTTLVIAHRLATVKRADRIIVLDAGRVVASGRHAELCAGDGLYARLAALQFAAGAAAPA